MENPIVHTLTKTKEVFLFLLCNEWWSFFSCVSCYSQEAAALAAGEVAYVIQAGQHGGVHFTIAPGPAVAHHPEPPHQ